MNNFIGARLMELAEQIREATAGEVIPLEDSPGGRDILHWVKQEGGTIGLELRVYGYVRKPSHYLSRVMTFDSENRSKRTHWKRSSLQLAAPGFIDENPEHLRLLMRSSLERCESVGVSVWLHSMSLLEQGSFLAFVMHQDGTEAAYNISDEVWTRLDWNPARTELLLGLILKADRTFVDWEGIREAHINTVGDMAREDAAKVIATCSKGALTDEAWDELLSVLFRNTLQTHLMREAARSTSVHLLIESQFLLSEIVRVLEKTVSSTNEKIAQLEKSQSRVVKRLKTDLDKFKSGREVAVARAHQLTRELHALQAQLKRASSGASVVPARVDSLGLALDDLFA